MSPRETPVPLLARDQSLRTEDNDDDDNNGGGVNVDDRGYSGRGIEEVGSERGEDVNMDTGTGTQEQGEDVRGEAGFEQSHEDLSADTGGGSGSGTGINEHTGMGNPGGTGNEDEDMGPPAFSAQTWVDFLRDDRIPSSLAQSRENPLPPLPAESRTSSGQYRQGQQPDYTEYPQPRGSPYSPYPFAYPSSSRNPLPPIPTQERRDSSDRKRRLTAAESPNRRGSGMRSSSSGSVRAAEGLAMDSSSGSTPMPAGPSASSSPSYAGARPPIPPPRGSQISGLRRESDLVLPPWQPDSEVSHCFVCGSQFTFFYRKHHCRKCGRVVCAACSPHRITIPRQFIVHPPNENTNIIDLTDDEENPLSAFGPFRNPALGGGEEVRVCNPCVPDPNYGPPPPYAPIQSQSPYTPQFSPPAQHPGQSHPHSRGGHRPSQSLNDGPQTVAGHAYTQSRPPRDPFSDRRTSYHDSTRVADLWPPQVQQQQQQRQQQHYPYDQRARSHSRPHPITSTTMPAPSQPSNRHSMGPDMLRRSLISPGANSPMPSRSHHHYRPQQQHASPAPRRQIPEEDECPICGNELPPKGPDGDEAERIKHVEECIALHSSSPTPAPSSSLSLPTPTPTSTSLPSQRTRGMSNAAGLAAGSNAPGTATPTSDAGNGEGNSSGARNRNRMSMNMSARGMLVYTATEKDCVDDEGQEAECVICFEEVVVGVKLARLVCFCKFHETCIRQWWDMKGRGACPTHQLHD